MVRRSILILFLAISAQFGWAQSNSVSFSFTIPQSTIDTRTSAAVYDSTGVLVKTLWGNVSYPPGTYTRFWDGTYDTGTSTPGANYTIKLLTNQVKYEYEGHIGSTDAQWYFPEKYSQNCSWYAGIPRIVFAGNTGWVACGYNEGANNVMMFDRSTPNYPRMPNNAYYDVTFHETNDIATDGKWMYLMEAASDPTVGANWGHNFVTALDASSGSPVYFSAGTYDSTFVWQGARRQFTATYIDDVPYPATNVQTGIAVQTNGQILAVAHGSTGTIELFDKTTGASTGQVTGVHIPTITPLFTPMAFSSEGLWYVSDGGLYLITGLPSSPSISQPITGLSYVVSVGVNPVTNGLYVADGGTHQQIFEYQVNTHALVRTLGVAGGMNDCNPTVTHTRFLLDNTPTLGANSPTFYFTYSFVSADSDDHVWVGDMDGMRIQQFDQNNNYVDQILVRRPSYWVTTSETQPTRVFITMLEYAINFNVPNLPGDPDPALGGNGSWTLVRNWKVCALGAHGSTPIDDGSQNYYIILWAEQLSNGHVYALVETHKTFFYGIMELPVSGTAPARYTGITMPEAPTYPGELGLNRVWFADTYGNLSTQTVTGTSPNLTVSVVQEPLTGFDANFNPIYGPQTTLISTTTTATNYELVPNVGGGVTMFGAPTTDGYYPVIRPTMIGINNYPHAAALKAGFPSYAWMTMPEKTLTVPDYKGSYPASDVNVALGFAYTEGKYIFYHYPGQYAAFGAQFYQYYEDGMLIGQFGNERAFPGTGLRSWYRVAWPVQPGNFGNNQWFSMTTYNGNIYIYAGDEAFAQGHRWKVSNLGTIHEYSATTMLQPNGSAALTQLF